MIEGKAEGALTRREAIKRGFLGAAGLTLIDPLRLLTRPAAAQASAKAVIQIWMWGGPAHLDTFDPKPDAGYDYCGQLAKAIPTNVDGIQIGESLPHGGSRRLRPFPRSSSFPCLPLPCRSGGVRPAQCRYRNSLVLISAQARSVVAD